MLRHKPIYLTPKRIDGSGTPTDQVLADERMSHIAFIKDPDGYWVEIIQFTEVE